MIDLDSMLERYASAVSPTSRNKNVKAVKYFLDFSNGDLSREKLLDFIKFLEKENYTNNTIRKHFLTALRRFFKVNNLEWPLYSWELPKVSERDVYAPALDEDVIIQMIEAAKEEKIKPEETAFLALSTTYGLRRIEMATLEEEDIDLENNFILVKTAKEGRERHHKIPEAIIPYLKNFRSGFTPRQLSKVFYRIEKASGLERKPEVGWHALRRSLTRLLIEAGIPEAIVRNFLRWKRSADDMILAYQATTVVGEEGESIELGKRDKEVDEAVFNKHPFLEKWRD